MMNFFFQGWTFFSRDQREVSCLAEAVGRGQTGRPAVKGKKKVQPRKKKFIKGFSFLYSSQLSCLRRQIHFLPQFLCVQPSVLEWPTYFIYPWFFNLPSLLSFKVSRSSPENSSRRLLFSNNLGTKKSYFTKFRYLKIANLLEICPREAIAAYTGCLLDLLSSLPPQWNNG